MKEEISKLPSITVITVCFNSVKEIEETIKSVINQTYSDIEYIIIDGGSTDGTLDVIEKYADKISYFVSEPDYGIYDAMNKGIKRATGDYINFMNAGDMFYTPETLQIVASKMNVADVYYGKVLRHTAYQDYLDVPRPLERIKECMPFDHQGVFVALSKIKQHLFNTAYKIIADYIQLNSIYKEGGRFEFINEIIAVRDDTKGISYDKWDTLGFKEMARFHQTDKTFYFISRYYYNLFKSFIFKNILSNEAKRKRDEKRVRKYISEMAKEEL